MYQADTEENSIFLRLVLWGPLRGLPPTTLERAIEFTESTNPNANFFRKNTITDRYLSIWWPKQVDILTITPSLMWVGRVELATGLHRPKIPTAR